MNFKKRINDSWVDTPNYIHKTDTDTFTTLPAVLYPTGSTATVGLKGNTVQSGTPTPSAPITPSECGERTKNLFDKDNADIADLYPDTTTREIKQSSNLSTWSIILPVEPSTTYTFTMGEAPTAIRRRVGMCSDYPTKGTYCTSVDDTPEYDHPNLGNIFTTDADTRYVLIMYVSGAGRDVAIERANRVQVVKGNTALPYEPYGYKIPISSANTTTPVYLGNVQTTRYVKKLVLDGTESWKIDATNNIFFYVNHLVDNVRQINGFCSHFRCFIVTPSNTANGVCVTANGAVRLRYSEYNTVDDFKSFLAQQYANGTPVTVWYVLATPTTGIVNEPLRKIGNYADEVSGITIPTIAGANTISVDTTLQPSEVTVNYKGWHPVADVHERESGAWD